MPFGLKDKDIDAIKTILALHANITKAIVYGSRAKGNYKNGSDIDITIIGEALTSRELNKIHNSLDDLLLPYTFDLSLFAQIENPDLVDHVKRVGMVLYERVADILAK